MALSKRLFSIFQMVEKGSFPADIGCDHALLSIALVEEGICKRAIACDLRKGPLSRANKAIEEHGLGHQIKTLLRDGIADLPEEVDTIIIAGMGFDTIKGILEAHIEELPRYRRIIVQSNKHVSDVRQWISNHRFQILCEDMVEEDHFYEVIAFSCTNGRQLSEEEILFGCFETHPLFKKYWQQQLTKTAFLLSKIPINDPIYSKTLNRYHTIEDKLGIVLHNNEI